MSWFNKYKQTSSGNAFNVAQNLVVDNEILPIPLNLPTFIVGSKNSGKSTLINTLINATSQNNIYTRYIYIYTDNVDTTLAEVCHTALLRVPITGAVSFLSQYFKIKTEFMSWLKFLSKNSQLLNSQNKPTIYDLLRNYTDNVIDEYVRNNLNINNKDKKKAEHRDTELVSDPIARLVAHAREYLSKYMFDFSIIIDDIEYHIKGLDFSQYDCLIIDDVGVAKSWLFPSSVDKSVLYKYLTISRHILLGTWIAGQDFLQLPRYARKEINTYVIGYGVDIEDLETTQIPKAKIKDIVREYSDIKQHDFIVYNGVDNIVTSLVNQ